MLLPAPFLRSTPRPGEDPALPAAPSARRRLGAAEGGGIQRRECPGREEPGGEASLGGRQVRQCRHACGLRAAVATAAAATWLGPG